MKPSHVQWLSRLSTLMEIPAPDPARLIRRIAMMERNIMLPVKLMFIFMLSYSFDYSPWVGQISSNLDDTSLRVLDLAQHDDLGQPFVLRLAVLGLTTICCWGAQVLLERQRLAVEEAGEFAAREGQLRSAGRLAAEFAHQIKNPLAI